MNSLITIPKHEPFLRSLPKDITLREISRRLRKLNSTQRLEVRETSRTEFVATTPIESGPYIVRPIRFLAPTPRPAIHFQIWGCLNCMHTRSWGFNHPENEETRPRLNCPHCKAPTRHAFIGVIGRTL